MKNEIVLRSNSQPVESLSEETIALSLTQQYDDITASTNDLVRKVVHFGCALAQAELELSNRGILANRKSGQGMQGWLAKNCPTLNYKTAMRWKKCATDVANSLNCSSVDALKILTGEITDISQKVAKRRDEIYSATSLRRLSQMLFNFAADDTGTVGRPTGSAAPVAKLTKVESARRLWSNPISIIKKNRAALYAAANLLPIDDARQSLEELKGLIGALEKRCKEGK